MISFDQYAKKIDELRAALDRYADAFKNCSDDLGEVAFKDAIEAAKAAGVTTDLTPWCAESLAYAHAHAMTRADWEDDSIDQSLEIDRLDMAIWEINGAFELIAATGEVFEDEEAGE